MGAIVFLLKKRFFKPLACKARKTSYSLFGLAKNCRATLTESVPFLIACAVFLSVVSLQSPILLFCLLLGSLMAVVMQQVSWTFDLPKGQLIGLQILAIALLLAVFWLDYFAAPAQAQFFGKAEDFFKNTLTEGSNDSGTNSAVSLVFNVLRALYLLYIAIALIGVVNAVRKDEDWQNIARTPLLVVVAVTIADVLTGFIIGS
ncbi:hypothetical protein NIES267_18750 [Calothrix parasitica NIES-267]|uniref:Uncharacterized protein n=1 Tax=Calothrix parasitica NIES-267 TaxID=1973488 RepID=A0A1Z4LMD1_9CYAN|nr:hypothetical protein NIES267_18750 [Calothrix parasitica NIES-267]